MPESKVRKKKSGERPKTTRNTKAKAKVKQKRWVAPTMVTLWLVGLAWIVVFYIARDHIKFLNHLGNWNLLIGIGAIAVGFVISTQWE